MFIEDGILIGITQEEALQTVLEIPEEVKKIRSLKIMFDEGKTKEDTIESFSLDDIISRLLPISDASSCVIPIKIPSSINIIFLLF